MDSENGINPSLSGTLTIVNDSGTMAIMDKCIPLGSGVYALAEYSCKASSSDEAVVNGIMCFTPCINGACQCSTCQPPAEPPEEPPIIETRHSLCAYSNIFDSKLVALGKGLSNTSFFDAALQDDDLSHLFDGEITFKGTAYDTSEELQIGGRDRIEPFVATSLMTDDDYHSDVFFEISKDMVRYAYRFDENINFSQVSIANPLSINFLDTKLRIINVSDHALDAVRGSTYSMNTGGIVNVEGKNVKLIDVSYSSVLIEVDGVSGIVSAGALSNLNGISIIPIAVYSRTERADSSADLLLGIFETYIDGYSYIGEDLNDPEWIWDLSALTSDGVSLYKEVPLGGNDINEVKVMRVENDFTWNDDSDNSPGVGECIMLPNKYIAICLDSLTVPDNSYGEYNFELDLSADFSDAFGNQFSSVPAIHIYTPINDGLELPLYSGISDIQNESVTVFAKDVWLFQNINGHSIDGTFNQDGYIDVFYRDAVSNKIKWHGSVADSDTPILAVNYGNTNGVGNNGNVRLFKSDYSNALDGYVNLTLDINPDSELNLMDGQDDLTMIWGFNAGKINSLGTTANTKEATELAWGPRPVYIGTKDEDHRGYYGIIIKNPIEQSLRDRVRFDIPADQVFANITMCDAREIEMPYRSILDFEPSLDQVNLSLLHGTNTSITINITNNGNLDLNNFNAIYVGSNQDSDGDNLSLDFQFSSTVLIPNQTTLLTIVAKADPNLDIGLYSGQIILTAKGIHKQVELNINIWQSDRIMSAPSNIRLIRNFRNKLIGKPSIIGKFFSIWF